MLILKEEIPQVSQDFMNNTHSEEVVIINAIFKEILLFEQNANNKDTLDRLYQEWIEHTIEHFTTEEVEMFESEFPAYPMHKGEHDRVLQQMKDVFNAWQKNRDIKMLKIYFIEVVPQWLIAHISTMDAMTANFLGGGISPSCGSMSHF